jgi:hypothetical protein
MFGFSNNFGLILNRVFGGASVGRLLRAGRISGDRCGCGAASPAHRLASFVAVLFSDLARQIRSCPASERPARPRGIRAGDRCVQSAQSFFMTLRAGRGRCAHRMRARQHDTSVLDCLAEIRRMSNIMGTSDCAKCPRAIVLYCDVSASIKLRPDGNLCRCSRPVRAL